MKSTKSLKSRRLRVAAALAVLALSAASVSISTRTTFEVLDSSAAPVEPVYFAYAHVGYKLNPVHPVSYQTAPLALARSDRPGRVVIPRALHVHRPFPLETHPKLRIEMVYAPGLHNAHGRILEMSESRPGLFELDDRRRRATVADVSDRPDLWEGTLRNLASLIHQMAARHDGQPALPARDPASAAIARELIGHFGQEYDGFLAKYGNVERTKPAVPDYLRSASEEERRRWNEAIDASYAREPRWGDLVRRIHGRELRALAAVERELR